MSSGCPVLLRLSAGTDRSNSRRERQIFGVDNRVLTDANQPRVPHFSPLGSRYDWGHWNGFISRKMDAVGRDRARFVSLAKQCLAFRDIKRAGSASFSTA